MTAKDYPITFPYGATDGVYYYVPTLAKPKTAKWVGPYHRGDDRAMPVGTPLVVNGLTVGLSGNTGASSGPHLHLGRFVDGKDTNPNGQGFSLENPVVLDVGLDSVNGKYIRIRDAKNVVWFYGHLSKVNVTAGQPVKEANMPTKEQVISYFVGFEVPGPTEKQIAYYTARPLDKLLSDLLQYNYDRRKELETNHTVLGPGNYTVKG